MEIVTTTTYRSYRFFINYVVLIGFFLTITTSDGLATNKRLYDGIINNKRQFENDHNRQQEDKHHQIEQIIRRNDGDVFHAIDVTNCNEDSCVGLSSGTASLIRQNDDVNDEDDVNITDGYKIIEDERRKNKNPSTSCTCHCHKHLPAFREDLQICVDDVRECTLAPFVSGSTSQQIPFVFLPLKGQIIHPSKEISLADVQKPICAVSNAKFLTESGWIDLRNPLDLDVPFRLFRDEGRTFLQWIGEPELRKKMTGRLILVNLLCREIGDKTIGVDVKVFNPCVAFRVVGTPSKYLHNVTEVSFSTDLNGGELTSNGDGLSMSEYVTIGVSSVLLGLIYVASVFLYIHLRRRKKDNETIVEERNDGNNKKNVVSGMEEGIVKSNPLLTLNHRHFNDATYSDSGSCSENERTTNVRKTTFEEDDRRKKIKNTQLTSAIVHPQFDKFASISMVEPLLQDSPSIEKLPEENVSIIETIEDRDDRDTIKCFNGASSTTRKKLYFNPAYFEPHLLLSPPPAAIEFLTKIREVITLAKQKMATKRFVPSLMEIPEEETDPLGRHQNLHGYSNRSNNGSRRSSMISLKRENSRRTSRASCNEPNDNEFSNHDCHLNLQEKSFYGKLPDYLSLAACKSCTTTCETPVAITIDTNANKQKSIEKWLENIPLLKNDDREVKENRKKSHEFESKITRASKEYLTTNDETPRTSSTDLNKTSKDFKASKDLKASNNLKTSKDLKTSTDLKTSIDLSKTSKDLNKSSRNLNNSRRNSTKDLLRKSSERSSSSRRNDSKQSIVNGRIRSNETESGRRTFVGQMNEGNELKQTIGEMTGSVKQSQPCGRRTSTSDLPSNRQRSNSKRTTTEERRNSGISVVSSSRNSYYPGENLTTFLSYSNGNLTTGEQFDEDKYPSLDGFTDTSPRWSSLRDYSTRSINFNETTRTASMRITNVNKEINAFPVRNTLLRDVNETSTKLPNQQHRRRKARAPQPPSMANTTNIALGGGAMRFSCTKRAPTNLPPNLRNLALPPTPSSKATFSPGTPAPQETTNHYYDTIPERPSTTTKILPPPDMINEAIVVEETKSESITLTKKRMRAVIDEFSLKCADQLCDYYESDSLERVANKKQLRNVYDDEYVVVSTPTSSSEQPSPSLSTALPMTEELTMHNAILTTTTTTPKFEDEEEDDEINYEVIVTKTKNKLHPNGYNLVSEVYVNNGYNYNSDEQSATSSSSSSTISSTPNSNSSTLERQRRNRINVCTTKETAGIRFKQDNPGHLLIEVEDCLDHYIKVDSDHFEQDTLDRKYGNKRDDYCDSLERPQQQQQPDESKQNIVLQTTGSFNKTDEFKRTFGSLREIYENKRRNEINLNKNNTLINNNNPLLSNKNVLLSNNNLFLSNNGLSNNKDFVSDKLFCCGEDVDDENDGDEMNDEEGRLLTLEERHAKRQRKESNVVPPPDVIPPVPSLRTCPLMIYENASLSRRLIEETKDVKKLNDDLVIYQYPKQPRKVMEKIVVGGKNNLVNGGNLLIDELLMTTCATMHPGSETDESLGDGQSESGGESVETHSVFFGSYRKTNEQQQQRNGSLDSGVETLNKKINSQKLIEKIERRNGSNSSIDEDDELTRNSSNTALRNNKN